MVTFEALLEVPFRRVHSSIFVKLLAPHQTVLILLGKCSQTKHGPRFCDMITTHTARRSFATNAYAAGVPLSSIMAITGHSREEKLRVYLKLQTEDKANVAARDSKGVLQL